jgi:glycyl-tRNA synthetase
VGIFPLVKNKPVLVERAKEIYKLMQSRWNVIYDQSGAIGRRYRRIDEAGVPFGITIDFDTIEGDGTVTVRNRDTTEQERLSVEEAIAMIEGEINP